MKLVRKSTFETNSSSCHSITIGTGDCYEGYTPNEDGTIILPPMEFGWAQETFTDVESRLAYVYVYIRDWCYEDHKIKNLEMFNRIVFAHTGATEISMIEHKCDYYVESGYIDHQAVESGDLNHLFNCDQTLKDFLFNSQSSITTDNDNH